MGFNGMYPETGGDYAFLRRAYGHLVAFLFAWTELLVIRTGSIAAVSYLFSGYACALLGVDKAMMRPLAIGIGMLLGAINVMGLNVGRKLQNTLSLTKVAAILLLISGAAVVGHGNVCHLTGLPQEAPSLNLVSSFLLALIPILWTYGGWQESVFVAGETKNAGKTLPFALTGVVFVVSSLYILANAVFLYLIPPDRLVNSTEIAADVLKLLYGGVSSKILEVLVVISAIGSINAMLIIGSRITYAMAHDVPLFKVFASESSDSKAPVRALGLNVAGACIFILLGTFERLLFFTGIAVWLFFALVVASVFVFRIRNPAIRRPFVVPLYPWLPACFIFVCVSLCLNTLWIYPRESLLGLALVASGIPVFCLSQYLVRKGILKQDGPKL